MKYAVLLLVMLNLSACGYSSRNNELIGQVKKVKFMTPLLCPERVEADISLGVMKNGVGSMSSQDVWVNVTKESDVALLKKAAEDASLVKITYSEKRFVFCPDTDHFVDKAELQ